MLCRDLEALGVLLEMVVVVVDLTLYQIFFTLGLEVEIRPTIIIGQFPLQIDIIRTHPRKEELHKGLQEPVRRLAHCPGDVGQVVLLPETRR
jgi:hypothetical protein